MVEGEQGAERTSAGQRFRAWHHIRAGADFEQTYARRASASDERLLVFVRKNGCQYSRLGLSVSKKHGNAVRRNRWKRLIREAFRLSLAELPAGIDIVVVPRIGQPELVAVRQSLVRLASRAARRLG